MKPGIACVLTCVGGVLVAGGARAADIYSPVTSETQPVVTESGWTFSVVPYFWAAGLSGNTGVFGLPTVHVDADFTDILNHLDFAAMVSGEARYGPYSIFSDLLYSKVSGVAGTPRGIVASTVGVESSTFAGLLGVGYALVDGPSGNLDIVAGARLWSSDTRLSFTGGILDGVSKSDGATWVDAMGGIRGTYVITPKVYLTGWGLVGAGGAKIDWDVAAGLGYRFNDRFSSYLSYRALGVNYSADGFVFDVVQQGPVLGMVIRF